MKMTRRISKTTTISMPPRLYRIFIQLARRKGMTQSELIRDALRRYQREEETWQEILAYGRRQASKVGIRTEDDVESLIDESRQ